MRRFAILLGLFVLLTLAPPVRAAEPSAGETKLREQIADEVAGFAAWCAEKGAVEEAQRALAEARALAADAQAVTDAAAAVEGASAAVEDVADDVAKKRKAAGAAIAKLYDKLAGTKHADEDDPRFQDYFFRAVAWEPSSARTKKAVAQVKAEKYPLHQARLLGRTRRADPEGDKSGAYDKVEQSLIDGNLGVLGSATHDLVAYVSLPGSWKKGKRYQVLVAVDGAGCNFQGCGSGFASSRGSRPFIVVSPVTLSNTNELDPKKYPYPKSLLEEWNAKRTDFDGPGMEAILAILRERYGAEDKVFLTGFSGGGNYTYHKLLTDPAGVAGAAPACANYTKQGLDKAPGAGPEGGPPVHLMTGEKDPHRDLTFGKPPGIETQTDWAQEDLKKLGYTRVRRTMVPAAGHSPLRKEVWDFIDAVLDGTWKAEE